MASSAPARAPRRAPFRRLLTALAAGLSLLLIQPPAAEAQSAAGLYSGYQPIRGQAFFLLTDTQYGSHDDASVRVEIPDRDGGRALVEAWGGVDIALYRVPEPLRFLQRQRNLHRIEVAPTAPDEGLVNTLAYLWDNWWKKSRFAWRDMFDTQIRSAVVQAAPALHGSPALKQPTTFHAPPHFRALPGFELLERFRYPVWQAKPIQPAEGVKLEGSSSNFISPREGNVRVPLGQLKPGLYLVEASIGSHRAVTLLFVSDTVAITKIASGALTVWAAGRQDGQPVAGAQLQWTDGRGTLKSARTGADGLATLEHTAPERTYLLGTDPAGGVFVSENFYYDSEIYNNKLYAVTDRPLYRPGDLVQLKLIGRRYESARVSHPLEPARLQLTVNDPNGSPVLSSQLAIDPASGADTAFRLPETAAAGGYEVRMQLGEDLYSAAFRVADYVKPHFTIELIPERSNFKTGEAVGGTLKLSYPDGKPVAGATIDLSARAQEMTMVEGELRYAGLFPVRLSNQRITSDARGEAKFALPPASRPSRVILTALATDGAAFRVRSTREVLVERAATSWRLNAPRRFSAPGEAVDFSLTPAGQDGPPPARWEVLRLEDRNRQSGEFAGGTHWKVDFPGPGSYSLTLRDQAGNIVAAASHWVSGNGLQAAPGSIEMVTDRPRYRAGDTAEVLVSFPEPVDQALLTLERDRVEASALLASGADWVRAERLTDRQWRLRIPVRAAYGPNMTLSVVVAKHGEYVFQNAGLVVAPPELALAIHGPQQAVAPGDTVEVSIDTSLDGKPVPAMLTVSVVDEMIYALQPEIAPDLREFFLHPRRNNVRTGASLNFITYDEAADASLSAINRPPPRHNYNERGVKVLERPRRDDTDTAAWLPALATDAQGHARFSFRMPDALSRWRITVRATGQAAADGVPGQRTAYVRSDKPLYAKWTSPDWLRPGDRPQAAVALFNNGDGPRKVEVSLSAGGQTQSRQASLPRGVSYLHFPLPALSGPSIARVDVRADGNSVDSLEQPLQLRAAGWRSLQQQILPLNAQHTPLQLPADARELRIAHSSTGAAQFMRIAQDLVDDPYGCVEQTSSRLIPLALATQTLADGPRGGSLRQQLYAQRLRLAALAGPGAVFGWWGPGTRNSALLSAYAYYADWTAAQVLGLQLPRSNWEHLLEIYRDQARREPLLHQALALWFAGEMGLPVATQTRGLLLALSTAEASSAEPPADPGFSPLLAAPDSALGLAYARVLGAELARAAKQPLPPALEHQLPQAYGRLAARHTPLADALLMLSHHLDTGAAPDLLTRIGPAQATFDRSLSLIWLRKALGALPASQLPPLQPVGDWQATASALGTPQWRWQGSALPQAIDLAAAPAPGSALVLRYTSGTGDDGHLDATLTRHLYRLQATDKGRFEKHALKPGEPLSADALYLDEIQVEAPRLLHYALVEAALPPGAAVEPTTWGVVLAEGDSGSPLERSRAQPLPGSYGVPIDALKGQTVLRHLLRFSQRGSFELPPARLYEMYQPARKAYTDQGKTLRWTVQ